MIRYQITDGTAHLNEGQWLEGISAEADFVQVRESGLSTRNLARLVSRLTLSHRVLVNDRMDVAIACGAAGVHLRSGSVSPELIRRICPPGFVISVACHGVEDVRSAVGADFAVLAPIFRPLSKEDSRPPLGLEALREITRDSPVPVIALGGITTANAALCRGAGAAGVAGITLFRRR